ncbi:unnamed protein product [Clonostachys rosea]|uniref:F-box domain-containing protein n=1 Tax=Bionectria ochroleuca TaxID=29856 RepID=A0ABY6UPN5_BIOOC|nr:unnamed protein product [Clonostachys rosea]
MTASSGLGGLPLEILQRIVDNLADSYRPSVYAFSLASKACHQASAPFIFQHINLRLLSREALQRDIKSLVNTLSRTDSARHVHSISMKGFLNAKTRNDDLGITDTDNLGWWVGLRGNEKVPRQETIYSGGYFANDEPVIEEDSDEDVAWAPVVNFIRTLPALEKLVYMCADQFPPSLLYTLHRYHPKCKLYHMTFRLRSLSLGTPHPYEVALATSPCLYGVQAICVRRDSEGGDDFNQEATMELVAGLAPNLKEVSMINCFPYRGSRFTSGRAQWKGLPGYTPGMLGSLTSLSLLRSAEYFWEPEYIQTWGKFTDFGSLQRLTIGGPSDKGIDGEMMGLITQNHSFPRLKALCVCLERNDPDGVRPEYGDNAAAFFSSFEPLRQLSVSGPLEPTILDTILHRHGQTLKELMLYPRECEFRGDDDRNREEIPMVLTKEHILQIQAECPALEDLAVPVKRKRSSAAEVEIYRTLARMEHLRSLFLTLDCSEWRVKRDCTYDPPFDEEDNKIGQFGYKRGILRELLMNCAVDETLARSIWETIREGNRRLESLKLWTTGAGQFGSGQIHIAEDLYTHMSRSWLIEGVPRDDKEIINIKELGRTEREAKDAHRRTVGSKGPRPKEMEVFRRIWPSKEGSESWYDDWSSIPLEV